MKKDDVELIQNILSGDEAAFNELIQIHQKSVHTLAWREIGDYHIAEEITQDTFLQVYNKLSNLRDPNLFSRWLHAIAKRRCIAWLRKKRLVMQSLELVSEDLIEKIDYTSYLAEQRETASVERRREIVENLLEKLPENERTTMILHYLGEMPCKAISQYLGVSLNTVKSRLNRARNRLKQEEYILQDTLDQRQDCMENQNRSIPMPVGSFEGDITTWALPDGAIARLGRGSEPAMAFSPDGQSLVIGTCTGLWLYNLTTLSPVALWETETEYVESVAISPNGKWLAASLSERLLKILDIQTGACLTQIKSGNHNECVTFSHDNRYIAVNSSVYDSTPIVEVWHAETGKPFAKFTAEDERAGHYQPISFSPDTRLIASTCMSPNSDDAGSILVWDMKSCKLLACLTAHTRWITTLCFSPCGKFLVSGGRDGKVYIWDVNTWNQIREYSDYGPVYSIIPSYSSDGKLRAAIVNYDESGPATISIRDLENNQQLYNDQLWGNTIDSPSIGDWGNNVLFSNGSQLAYEYRHEFINVWTVDNPIKHQFTHSPISWPTEIVFSQDGKTLAAQHFQEGVVLWDIESKRSRPAVQVESAGKNQFLYKTDSGKFHVASIKSDIVTLWEADGNGIPLLEGTGREYWSAQPALTPTGTLFAYAGQDGTIQVWDVHSKKKLYEFMHPLELSDIDDDEDEGDYVDDLKFSQDGKLLVSESNSRNVKLWDMELGEEIIPLQGDKISDVRFCRCGQYHAYLEKEGNRYWDIAKREYCEHLTCRCEPTWSVLEKRLSMPPKFEQFDGPAAYSLCGQYLAFGTSNKDQKKYPIDVWEVSSGNHLVTLLGPSDRLDDLTFSPDNKLLASASYDGVILLWDLTPYL
ncbi:sigma-70 family RNA polymerase sigma factor [Candidatus Poribacteria bacterium]|nr:sigma-70 family RNA polymerase sigma factor [Candidatus Poribacteria bacterium]